MGMERLTTKEIAELRLLDAAATPPPWEARACSVVTPTPGFDMDVLPRPEEADVIAAARNALPRLLDEVERSRALLKRIEWKGATDAPAPRCPCCRRWGEDVPGEPHEPGCELAALLGP